jgi:hypothetical protein
MIWIKYEKRLTLSNAHGNIMMSGSAAHSREVTVTN